MDCEAFDPAPIEQRVSREFRCRHRLWNDLSLEGLRWRAAPEGGEDLEIQSTPLHSTRFSLGDVVSGRLLVNGSSSGWNDRAQLVAGSVSSPQVLAELRLPLERGDFEFSPPIRDLWISPQSEGTVVWPLRVENTGLSDVVLEDWEAHDLRFGLGDPFPITLAPGEARTLQLLLDVDGVLHASPGFGRSGRLSARRPLRPTQSPGRSVGGPSLGASILSV